MFAWSRSLRRWSTCGHRLQRHNQPRAHDRQPHRTLRRCGQVQLGLDGSGLDETANATLSMLVVVFFASLFALGLGLTWMTRRHQLGLKRLGWGLKRLQRGQFEFRLETDRRDEFRHTPTTVQVFRETA